MDTAAAVDESRLAGLSRVALPIGVNAVESVNMHVLADGDRVTLVDCGVWRPDLPDGGLAAVEAGLEAAGYALRDVARIVVTHAHIDHYGLAGRLIARSTAIPTPPVLADGTPMPITVSRRLSARISPTT
jgi:glyoxylase-like metal-dependent hydrolase (beta-lactamase superfamily II)